MTVALVADTCCRHLLQTLVADTCCRHLLHVQESAQHVTPKVPPSSTMSMGAGGASSSNTPPDGGKKGSSFAQRSFDQRSFEQNVFLRTVFVEVGDFLRKGCYLLDTRDQYTNRLKYLCGSYQCWTHPRHSPLALPVLAGKDQCQNKRCQQY